MNRRIPLKSALGLLAALACLVWPSVVGAQGASEIQLPAAQVKELAHRLAERAKDVRCKPRDCRLLVADFVLDSGMTSPLGMALGDSLVEALAVEGFAVVPRSSLRHWMEEERIPVKDLDSDEALQWLGRELGAAAVISGRTQEDKDGLLAFAHVVSVKLETKEARSRDEVVTWKYSDPAAVLTPMESYSSKDSSPLDGERVARAGAQGVSNPVCLYCPIPDYTDPARKAKFRGDMVLDLLVASDGSVRKAKVVRGLPFGLTKSALSNVQRWRFKPAMRDGSPIDSLVIAEVTFRIF